MRVYRGGTEEEWHGVVGTGRRSEVTSVVGIAADSDVEELQMPKERKALNVQEGEEEGKVAPIKEGRQCEEAHGVICWKEKQQEVRKKMKLHYPESSMMAVVFI